MIRGIRGAITVPKDDEGLILAATEKLVLEIISQNNLQAEDVAHALITVTHDLHSTFPAKVLRNIEGWRYVPVMCSLEIPVPNSLEKCIRILLTVNTTKGQEDISHVYLENATILRPDLQLTEESKSS
ncbi:chorismate mutase [Bacillus alkalicellulosilyticus]|uniref:chorismate mutase n=1 Tax=Alkalihalobacterium alkalicellulosilyticum TaxID=1912214 RepID=UPI0009983AE6|nr:chorismate mutase [Bacillus alkalicellulosilyticus]